MNERELHVARVWSRDKDRPPPWIDAAWWEVMSAPLRARHLTQETWINNLARAWMLIRVPESLTPDQVAEQEDMRDRALGLKFYPTVPETNEKGEPITYEIH